jgi:hypothetical protein
MPRNKFLLLVINFFIHLFKIINEDLLTAKYRL